MRQATKATHTTTENAATSMDSGEYDSGESKATRIWYASCKRQFARCQTKRSPSRKNRKSPSRTPVSERNSGRTSWLEREAKRNFGTRATIESQGAVQNSAQRRVIGPLGRSEERPNS